MSLWKEKAPSAWRRGLLAYVPRVEAREVSRLPELDQWYREVLPEALATRHPPFVTHDELVKATEWKMKRGTYRARNLVLVRGNSDAAVERASREAFAARPDFRAPVQKLCALDGVGPATASALLAALSPELYPFFDEDVAAQIPGLGPIAFTVPYYLRYAAALRERASAFSARARIRGHAWTAQDVAQALWATRP